MHNRLIIVLLTLKYFVNILRTRESTNYLGKGTNWISKRCVLLCRAWRLYKTSMVLDRIFRLKNCFPETAWDMKGLFVTQLCIAFRNESLKPVLFSPDFQECFQVCVCTRWELLKRFEQTVFVSGKLTFSFTRN